VAGFSGLLKALGAPRLAAMGAVAVALFAFFAYMVLRFSEPSMAPLYTGLSFDDSAAVIGELDSQGVPYQITSNGQVVLVAEEDVLRLRMQLAERGLPSGGGVGYEIFDETDALGTTSFVQNVNALRALEGELARTIRTIGSVEAARVHLVLPERQLFRRDAPEVTASIALRTRGAIDPGQIRAIQHLVASAVPGLDPLRISIVDESGRLLATGTEGADALTGAGYDERTISYQARLKRQIEEIIGNVVGPGRARVEVAAELDFNRVTEVQQTFDPESQVVRSTQTSETTSTSSEPSGEMTVGNELPNADAALPGPAATDSSSSTEEVINYEISSINKTEVVEGGRVNRLSVAVLVDGNYVTGPDGTLTYAARTTEEIDRITALVRSAMGFSETRGDQLEVVNLQFAERPGGLPLDEVAPGLFDFTTAQLMKLVELAVLVLVALIVVFVVVRPLLRRILAPEAGAPVPQLAPPPMAALPAPLDGGVAPQAALPAPAGMARSDAALTAEGGASRIDAARALGAANSDQIRRVGELVHENPGEASQLIRNWLTEAA
jgi:flagellar M-ring protein FliF